MHFIIGNLENTEIYVKDNVKVSLNPSHPKVKFLMYLLLVFPFLKAKYDLTLKTKCNMSHIPFFKIRHIFLHHYFNVINDVIIYISIPPSLDI